MSYNTYCISPGDRVRIKEGFYRAGKIFIVLGRSTDEEQYYVLKDENGREHWVIAEALEFYPYTKKEQAKIFCKKHGLSKEVLQDLVRLLGEQ